MFMFRSKRKNLIRQLKARKKRCHEARRAIEESSPSPTQQQQQQTDAAATRTTAAYNNNNNHHCHRYSGGASDYQQHAADELFKQLNNAQLEMLMNAVDGRGQKATGCVLLARNSGECDPHVLCCQLYRWSELRHAAELRRMPECRSAGDTVYICCNPFHWSRLCQPDSPPPPYSHCAMDSFKPEDRAPSEAPIVCRDSFIGSLTTSGEDSSLTSRSWCKLAYWEMQKRVGQQFAVEPSYLNVFGDTPCGGDGLSLKELARHSFGPPDSVVRTRCKIGLGVTLSKEEDGIWVYNRSEQPVFVNSLTLEDPCASKAAPTRVPAEHCICVFDPARAAHQNYGWDFATRRHHHQPQRRSGGGGGGGGGPIDPNSVQISFAKGWGANYTRQDITACPCWLEVLLEPCR